ncbi:hypothetical protein WJX72_011467 [[Myrmecia] bisecta]|uniref:Uncharacterized protein n=1 Tax=[Myrmecia] bisecta TaxID=41462 RepID=A0AAW1R8P9_9CHLO
MSTLTESYTGDISLGCTREDVVGHANRLASVLRLSDRSERSTHGDAGPYAELVAALLAADDAGEAVQPIAALKPCLPALLSNLCDAKQTACGTRWLDPVAEVLGQALSEEFTAFQHTRTAGAGLEVAHPGTTAEGVDADGGAAQQENVPSNVQQPTSDAAVAELSARKEKTGRGSEQQAGFAWVGVAMASTFAKALVAAAVNAKHNVIAIKRCLNPVQADEY